MALKGYVDIDRKLDLRCLIDLLVERSLTGQHAYILELSGLDEDG